MYQIPIIATPTTSNLTKRFSIIKVVARAVNMKIEEPNPSRKFEIAGPILGSPKSHFSKRGFEIENNQAAMIIKTVVGSPGTTIPIIPITTHIKPRRVKVAFFALVKIFFAADMYLITSR